MIVKIKKELTLFIDPFAEFYNHHSLNNFTQDAYNKKYIKNKNKCYDFFINFSKLLTQNKSCNEIKKILNIPFQTQFISELWTTVYILFAMCHLLQCNSELSNIISCKSEYKELIERVYIRIILLKDGWKPETIEKCLNKNYNMNWTINKYKLPYFFISKCINGNLNCIEIRQKGRPIIPDKVKNILKVKWNEKNRLRTQQIYSVYKLKQNISFTIEDIQHLTDCIELSSKDESIKNNLLHKLSKLSVAV
jgi:hypothetical protein